MPIQPPSSSPKPPLPPNPPTSTTSTPATPTPATSTPLTPASSTPTDRFEKTPGHSFLNRFLGMDRNSDGQISRREWTAGREELRRLATDGKENDRAEQSAFRLLLRHQGSSSTPDAPALSYTYNDGRLSISSAAPGGSPSSRPLVESQAPMPSSALPAALLERVEAKVIHGTDPGDYYCEHMFFGAQMAASSPGSSVLTNAHGEKMVGFLHIPSDTWTSSSAPLDVPQAERHAGTRHVIGAAMRGYLDEILPQTSQNPVTIALSGYDQFMSVRNNPTGDFVSHRENIDASMKIAFGDRLQTLEGIPIPPSPSAAVGASPSSPSSLEKAPTEQAYRYTIQQDDGSTRDILVTAFRFPVADATIDPASSASIQNAMQRHKPHAVISMGVAGYGAYKAEHRADSGGLIRSDSGTRHTEDASDTLRLLDNFSLARAIHQGSR